MELLTANLSEPFAQVPGGEDSVKDKRNGVLINLLATGRVLKSGGKPPFPDPPEVWDQSRFVSSEKLLSLKLDGGSNSSNRRLKDKAGVVELIKALHLPRELAVDEAARALPRNLGRAGRGPPIQERRRRPSSRWPSGGEDPLKAVVHRRLR